MKTLTQKGLWPHERGNSFNTLFRFCERHGQTLQRKVVVSHASSDFVGCFTHELTETRTTRNCGYGLMLSGNMALRQTDSNESYWEVIENYLEKQEKVVIEIRSWDDLVGTETDAVLAEAIIKAKEDWKKRIEALLASVPEPKTEPKKPKVDFINDDVIDWSDYDDDDYLS